jgi:signal transduction histidine kinase
LEEGARRVIARYLCFFTCMLWAAVAAGFCVVHKDFGVGALLSLGLAAVGLTGYLLSGSERRMRAVLALGILAFIGTAGALLLSTFGIAAAMMVLAPMLATLCLVSDKWTLRIFGLVAAPVCILILFLGVEPIYSAAGSSDARLLGEIASLSVLEALSLLCSFAAGTHLSRGYAFAELQRTHSNLVETTSRSQLALEAARVGLWDLSVGPDRTFNITPSLSSITGYSEAEIQQAAPQLRSFVFPDDLVRFDEAIREGAAGHDRVRLDLRLRTKARGYRWFALRAQRSGSPHAAPGWSGSLQDIHFMKVGEDALRVARDRAREADRAKSDFIAVMSHEVRTPLNAILGAVALMKRRPNDPDTHELLRLADDAGQGLLSLVNDLLDVSRIEAGKMDIHPAPTDVAAMVRRAVESWTPEARARGLSLEVDLEDRVLPQVRVDGARIRQVIANLVSNALKFTQAGGVVVSLRVGPPSDDAVMLTLEVSDTGPGIPEGPAATLFQPFEQAGAGGRGGSGLGLYISRNLARLMGGDLSLVSTSREGARFRLELPAPLASPAQAATPDTASDPVWKNARILCVDDNDANRRIIHHILAHFGAKPTLSHSGQDALQRCAADAFDLVLLDILMPDLDGFQTLERLRGQPGPNQTTPVIALTARLSPEDVTRYHAAGFNGVAGKPIDIADLARLLSPRLQARASRAA